jgi:hypothetical protein
MIDIKITVDNKQVLDALDKINQGAWAREVGDAVAEEVVLPMLRYYPPQSGKSQPFKSDKSRRFFFAALRKGKISVPYQRTSGLAAGWEVTQPSLFTTNVANRKRYANLVQGDGQVPYHKGTWKTVDIVAEDAEEDAEVTAARVLQEIIDRAT